MATRIVIKYREVTVDEKMVNWKLISNRGTVLHDAVIPSMSDPIPPPPMTGTLSNRPLTFP